jgi:methylated-DNA-[protein]-cysteine S-methyltransferase
MESCLISTPVGPLRLEADHDFVVGIHFRGALPRSGERSGSPAPDAVPAGVLAEAAHQLAAYFSGRLRTFDLPLAPGGTPFQQEVWAALQTIPYGQTWSYAELAGRIARPSAVRAVGAANGRNPIPIVIPCHRVIGSSGKLVGFGGGLDVKRALLALEQGQSRLP